MLSLAKLIRLSPHWSRLAPGAVTESFILRCIPISIRCVETRGSWNLCGAWPWRNEDKSIRTNEAPDGCVAKIDESRQEPGLDFSLGGSIEREAMFIHRLFGIAIAEGITRIPAQAEIAIFIAFYLRPQSGPTPQARMSPHQIR